VTAPPGTAGAPVQIRAASPRERPAVSNVLDGAMLAIDAGLWPVAAVILLRTVLTLAYVARILEQLYFTPRPAGELPDLPVEPHDGDPGDEAVAADGGATEAPTGVPAATDAAEEGAPFGLVAVAAAAAVLAVLLGFAGPEFSDALEPFVTEVLGQ